jgi:hypothetical protein
MTSEKLVVVRAELREETGSFGAHILNVGRPSIDPDPLMCFHSSPSLFSVTIPAAILHSITKGSISFGTLILFAKIASGESILFIITNATEVIIVLAAAVLLLLLLLVVVVVVTCMK